MAIGVTCWILAQAVINIGGVVDALPVTGIPLPFISYGGSSLVVALIGVGLLFGIARRQPAAAPERARAALTRARRPARTFAILTGGGTAGHVQPALAVGEALVARGHEPSAIVYVGSERGMEARLVPEAGFEVALLPGRAFNGGSPARTRRRLRASAPPACWACRCPAAPAERRGDRRGLRGPSLRSGAAVLSRVPLVVVSCDAVAGASNRLVARFARKCAVAFRGTTLPNRS